MLRSPVKAGPLPLAASGLVGTRSYTAPQTNHGHSSARARCEYTRQGLKYALGWLPLIPFLPSRETRTLLFPPAAPSCRREFPRYSAVSRPLTHCGGIGWRLGPSVHREWHGPINNGSWGTNRGALCWVRRRSQRGRGLEGPQSHLTAGGSARGGCCSLQA